MPSISRPNAYEALCRVLRHLGSAAGAVTVRSVLDANVVSDPTTARNCLEALARHGLASKRPARGAGRGSAPAEYWMADAWPAGPLEPLPERNKRPW